MYTDYIGTIQLHNQLLIYSNFNIRSFKNHRYVQRERYTHTDKSLDDNEYIYFYLHRYLAYNIYVNSIL